MRFCSDVIATTKESAVQCSGIGIGTGVAFTPQPKHARQAWTGFPARFKRAGFS